MKKIGKIIAFVGIAGAAVGGLWYFLANVKSKKSDAEGEEEAEGEEGEDHSYVSLDLDDVKEEAKASEESAEEKAEEGEDKEALKKAVTDAVNESKAKAEEEADGVGLVKEEAADKADDFEFKSFDEK